MGFTGSVFVKRERELRDERTGKTVNTRFWLRK